MIRYVFASLLICVCACSRQHGGSRRQGPMVAVPEFTIRIALTEAAARGLSEAGETIRGSVFFDGDGTPLPNVKTAPMRDVFLGSYRFELEKPGELRIADAVISEEAFSRLSDTNYHFFVNVYSGRRVFPNNVLRGGLCEG